MTDVRIFTIARGEATLPWPRVSNIMRDLGFEVVVADAQRYEVRQIPATPAPSMTLDEVKAAVDLIRPVPVPHPATRPSVFPLSIDEVEFKRRLQRPAVKNSDWGRPWTIGADSPDGLSIRKMMAREVVAEALAEARGTFSGLEQVQKMLQVLAFIVTESLI